METIILALNAGRAYQEGIENMIKRPDSVPSVSTAYKRPLSSGYSSAASKLNSSPARQTNAATFNGCTLPSGFLSGSSPVNLSDNLSTTFKKAPASSNPLDLSLRTIRVTPDSTAVDDHVMYLDHQEHKMIPAPSPQTFMTPANHDRRLTDVSSNAIQHYAMNGAPFGMIQGNTSIPPNSVSYDMFPPSGATSSPVMSSHFSALHPLTSDLLQRNTMFSNPSPSYDQYHPAGYPSAQPTNYQMQPSISRVSCDGISSFYQAPPASMRSVKHIPNMMADSKNLMPSMYPSDGGQMIKNTAGIATTIPSAAHNPPLQPSLMHDIQSSSLQSAFQKPVCTKECCRPSLPPPCACCWNPKQPTSSYSGGHRSLNAVYSTANNTSNVPVGAKCNISNNVHDDKKSMAFKYQQQQHQHQHQHQQHHLQHRNNHQIPPHNIRQPIHDNQSHPQCHAARSLAPHENSIRNLQNSVHKVNSMVKSSGNPLMDVHANLKTHYPIGSTDRTMKHAVVPNHPNNAQSVPCDGKQSYSKSVAMKRKQALSSPLDPTNGGAKYAGAVGSSVYSRENYLLKKGGLSSGKHKSSAKSLSTDSSNVPVVTLSDDNDGGTNDTASEAPSNQMGDGPPRVPTCWRPPVSFPDNSAKSVHSPFGADQRNGPDFDKGSYQQNSLQNYRTPNSATADDENRVSSTSDLPQVKAAAPPPPLLSAHSEHEPNPTTSKSERLGAALTQSVSTSKLTSANSQKAGAHPPSRDDEDLRRKIALIQNAERQLFDSYNFDMWLWARRRQYRSTRRQNLLKNLEDESNILKRADRSTFPDDWRVKLAEFKLSMRVPNELISFPEGFKVPERVVEKPSTSAEATSVASTKEVSEKTKDFEVSKKAEVGKASKISVLERLVDKYHKRQIRSRNIKMRMARNESESEDESDSDSESDSEPPSPDPVPQVSKKFAQKPAPKIATRTRSSVDRCKSPDASPPRRRTVTRSFRRSSVERKQVVRRHRGAVTKTQNIFDDSDSSDDSSSEDEDDNDDDDDEDDDDDDAAWNKSSASSASVERRESRKERESRRSTDRRAPRKRSPLDKLVSSDGYVGEKKKPKTDNLFSDSSLLGREQRALQRAMFQFTALEHTHDKVPAGRKKKVTKKNIHMFERSLKRQLRNRSVEIKTKSNHERDVMKMKTRKQNGMLRNVTLKRLKRKFPYNDENKSAHIKNNNIYKKLRSSIQLRTKNQPLSKKVLRNHSVSKKESEEEHEEEVERSDDPPEDDDYKPNKLVSSSQSNETKKIVTRSSGINLQSQWQQTQQKKRLFALRKRRFRSGLDMINVHQRQKRRREMCLKKYGADHYKQRIEAARSMKLKTEAHINSTDGPPAELKKIMINKALGETILHRASRLGYSEVVLNCLDTNMNEVNSKDNAGYTPLHECCAKGHVNIANYLLQFGADPNASAAGGIRPIHDAIENNHIEIVRLLLSYGADPTITTYSGASPLRIAKTEAMSEFLNGFFADISGDSKNCNRWKFHGTCSIFDPKDWGCNVFDNAPTEDSDVEDDSIIFEVSDKPHLPTYLISPGSSSTETIEPGSYILLQDVLQDLRMTNEAFTSKHKNINVVVITRNQFIEIASCSQIFPQHDVGSSIANIDRVQSKTVQLISLDDEIRGILGVECITVG